MVAERARQSCRLAERAERLLGPPGAMARLAEPQHHGRAVARLSKAELERRPEALRRLVVRQRAGGRLGREHVVVDGPLDAADGHRGREVIGERRKRRAAVGLRTTMLERLADPKMELRLPCTREAVGDRAADELVCEPVRKAEPGLLDDKPTAEQLVDRVEQRCLADDSGVPQRVELELRSRDRRQLEQPVRVR